MYNRMFPASGSSSKSVLSTIPSSRTKYSHSILEWHRTANSLAELRLALFGVQVTVLRFGSSLYNSVSWASPRPLFVDQTLLRMFGMSTWWLGFFQKWTFNLHKVPHPSSFLPYSFQGVDQSARMRSRTSERVLPACETEEGFQRGHRAARGETDYLKNNF